MSSSRVHVAQIFGNITRIFESHIALGHIGIRFASPDVAVLITEVRQWCQ